MSSFKENDKSKTEQNLKTIKINKINQISAFTPKTVHSNTNYVGQFIHKSDMLLWLHNKLGITNDSWIDGSICSQLSPEILNNIKDCFLDLQTQVKLKLLLSFVYIPEKKLKEWSVELNEILKLAQMDSEQWVSILAEIIRPLPEKGLFSTDIVQLNHLVSDLQKSVNKCDLVLLPLECYYLNKNVFENVIHQKCNIKHFTLKEEQKSTSVRANLIQKSMKAAQYLNKNTTPLMQSKKITDTPSAGIRRLDLKNLSRPYSRKDGGIKLLDINEQPVYLAQKKKRKSCQNLEEVTTASETVTKLVQSDDSVPEYTVSLNQSTSMN